MKKTTILIFLLSITRLAFAQNMDKVYANYDFIPGDKILFEDNFNDDQNGEFPEHWKLEAGQGIMNKTDDRNCFFLTEGNYAVVSPRMKNSAYLGDAFTLEFDFIYKTFKDEGYGSYSGAIIVVINKGQNDELEVTFGKGEIRIGNLLKSYPAELNDSLYDKWHHAALVYKDGQMKTYIDQFRVCVNPSLDIKPAYLSFESGVTEQLPMIFSNVRLASGGGMNMTGKKFTDAKIVTHGINFDYNKATIKPESMGTLNMIVQVMKDNPDIKFEIGGHTDGDGDDDYNLKLSQQRADAVKDKLIALGVSTSRLSAKGYGKAKPISDNTTIEGKANNRRVEFVKLP